MQILTLVLQGVFCAPVQILSRPYLHPSSQPKLTRPRIGVPTAQKTNPESPRERAEPGPNTAQPATHT